VTAPPPPGDATAPLSSDPAFSGPSMAAQAPSPVTDDMTKLPPDALVLRPPVPPTVRFRRGLIIGLAASASAALCAVTYVALRPPHTLQTSRPEAAAASIHPGQTILDAPASYDTLPRLVVPPDAAPIDPAVPSTAAEPSRLPSQNIAADQRHAAQTSPVLVTLTHTMQDNIPTAPVASDRASSVATGTTDDPAQQKSEFAFAGARSAAVDPHRLMPPAGGWLLSAGSIISASLITGIDSDLPGEIVAQVSDRVYDSITGEILLIPQGARLIGRSDNRVSYGQNRALIAWQRLILPDGSSIELDSLPGGDASGFAGLTDQVDRHEGRLIGGVALTSLLDMGSELSIGSGSGSIARALRQSVQQAGSDVASQFAAHNLGVQPTIRVRPGWPVTVVVREDLLLKPWKGR
jgi:type IV secretion system protein TrbI